MNRWQRGVSRLDRAMGQMDEPVIINGLPGRGILEESPGVFGDAATTLRTVTLTLWPHVAKPRSNDKVELPDSGVSSVVREPPFKAAGLWVIPIR
ncbi:hypothetical protein D3C73_284240 [compost metagenome]